MPLRGWPGSSSPGLLFREGRRCPARRDEALQLVQTPARVHRRVPAGAADPCAPHQPGVPAGHAAAVDPHVSRGDPPPSLDGPAGGPVRNEGQV